MIGPDHDFWKACKKIEASGQNLFAATALNDNELRSLGLDDALLRAWRLVIERSVERRLNDKQRIALSLKRRTADVNVHIAHARAGA